MDMAARNGSGNTPLVSEAAMTVDSRPTWNHEPTIGPKCGTYAGWNVHMKAGERPCDPCRDAATEYARTRRNERPDVREQERRDSRARSAAVWRLAAMHRDEYELLLADELRVEARRARQAVVP
jgi:hypothetical protein